MIIAVLVVVPVGFESYASMHSMSNARYLNNDSVQLYRRLCEVNTKKRERNCKLRGKKELRLAQRLFEMFIGGNGQVDVEIKKHDEIMIR